MRLKFGFSKVVLLVAAAIVSAPSLVMAAATTISGTASLIDSITLTPTAMNFGTVIFTGVPAGADTYTLNTNGTTTPAGIFTDGGGTKAAGNVHIVANAGDDIVVTCDSTAVLAKDATTSIQMNAIKIKIGGVDTACADAVPLGPYTMGVGGTADFAMGGRLNGGVVTGTWGAGTYSTTTAPLGSDINVTVAYN